MCVPGCAEALSRRRFFGAAAGAGVFAATIPTTVQAQRSFAAVTDLTHTLSPESPTFFGTPGITIDKRYTFKKNGANVSWWHVLEHAGTHIDAPLHYSDDGISVEKIPVTQLVLPLAVIDVTEKAARNADYALGTQDIANWEARHGALPEDCCVAMHSGWSRHINNAATFAGRDASGIMHFPGFDPAAAEWLLTQRRVVGLAVDTLSLDPGNSKDFRTHALWLPAGRWGIENIANLDKVPPVGATLVVGAPKVKDATGGPARVFALI